MTDSIKVVSHSIESTQQVATPVAETAPAEVENESTESASSEGLQDENTENNSDDSQENDDQQSDDVADDTADESNDDDQQEQAKPKKQGGYKKRIAKLQTSLSQKDQEIAYLRGQMQARENNDKGQNSHAEKPARVQQLNDGEPNPDDFDTFVDYNKALIKYQYGLGEKEKSEKAAKDNALKEYQSTLDGFKNKTAEFKKSAKDFDSVLSSVDDVMLQPKLQQEILGSEFGPQVMYELSKNRAELERINALSPERISREVAKIEAKIELAQSNKQPSTTKKITSAPAPISPVRGTSTAVKKTIYDRDISQADYERLRRQDRQAQGLRCLN